MTTPFTQLHSQADFDSYVKAATSKVVLVAFWPGDATSDAVIEALHSHLPQSVYAQSGLSNVYCFDAYALPDLATELDITFVPTLMWFADGVMDPVVWHEGVAVQGESIKAGVQRVVKRIKGAKIGHSDDEDDW